MISFSKMTVLPTIKNIFCKKVPRCNYTKIGHNYTQSYVSHKQQLTSTKGPILRNVFFSNSMCFTFFKNQ